MRPAKKPLWRFLDRAIFLGKGASRASPFAWPLRPSLRLLPCSSFAKNEMIRVLHEEHEFSDRFIAYMLARNVRVEEDLIDQLFNSSEKRLAHSAAARALWCARPSSKGASQSIARDAFGDDRHHAAPGQFFHEQIQETGFHPIQQGRDPHRQFPLECRPPRLN